MEILEVMSVLYDGIAPTMTKCGFYPEYQEGSRKTGCPAYLRGDGAVMDFSGEKGVTRFVFSVDRIHMLFAANDADRGDDSAFTRDTTYLYVLDEYTEKDAKGIAAEINDYMEDTFVVKKKKEVSVKNINTVSRSKVKSGLLAYDPVTLATKLAGLYPELKTPLEMNIQQYGEFLCEDFFVNHANRCIENTIRENNSQKMKRLFNILSEVYEDGTNEVQSLIAVTALGFIQNDPELIQRILPLMSDSMIEPVTAVSLRLKKSKSARMRLENPPKYKPPKKKKKGFMEKYMNPQGSGIQQ